MGHACAGRRGHRPARPRDGGGAGVVRSRGDAAGADGSRGAPAGAGGGRADARGRLDDAGQPAAPAAGEDRLARLRPGPGRSVTRARPRRRVLRAPPGRGVRPGVHPGRPGRRRCGHPVRLLLHRLGPHPSRVRRPARLRRGTTTPGRRLPRRRRRHHPRDGAGGAVGVRHRAGAGADVAGVAAAPDRRPGRGLPQGRDDPGDRPHVRTDGAGRPRTRPGGRHYPVGDADWEWNRIVAPPARRWAFVR